MRRFEKTQPGSKQSKAISEQNHRRRQVRTHGGDQDSIAQRLQVSKLLGALTLENRASASAVSYRIGLGIWLEGLSVDDCNQVAE
jgi:ribosomal protein L32